MGKRNTIQNVLLRLVICEPTTLETGCWEWPGAKAGGYGAVTFQGKFAYVHRLVYEHFVGPVPDGLELDHLCRNHPCANFEHLEPVTRQVNLSRGIGNGYKERTCCPRGHPLVEGNLVLYKQKLGHRECLTCSKEYKRRWYQKRKQDAVKRPVD